MKLLRDQHPELRSEWDFSKNTSASFDSISSHSKLRVWWKCEKDPRHIWETQIRDRTLGHGCPYCSGRYTLREESFGYRHPDLVLQLHPTKNPNFDPFSTGSLSNKRVWWICSQDRRHEWDTRLSGRTKNDAGCPECRRIAKSLSKVAPELLKEWHPTKNLPLTPEAIAAGSRAKVWWRCQKDESHIWFAQVRMRVEAKTDCPFCARQRPQEPCPSVANFSAHLCRQWHSEKNGKLTPNDVTVGSHRKVWWRCEKDSGHEWEASVRNRAKLGHGCPMCAARTGRTAKNSNLAVKFPKLADQWIYERNAPLKPEDFTPGSTRRVWWRCSGTPAHEWEATIHNRSSRHPEGECPFCARTRLSSLNSLSTAYPEIAKEWHSAKNGKLTPDEITRASGKRVWWQCRKNPIHSWQTTVKNRTVHKSGCPICETETRSERLLQALLEAAQSNTDSHKTFKRNIASIRTIARKSQFNTIHLNQALSRMLFVSTITALETYLSDTFLQKVMPNEVLLEKLLASAPEFSEKKYSLSEIVNWKQNFHRKIGEYLYDIVWHNLGKVRQMYSTVLGVTFPDDATEVHRSIAIRHDLVHRNGKTKEGKVHRFTPADLETLFKNIEVFVEKIQQQL